MKLKILLLAMLAMTITTLPAQTYTVLHGFSGSDGSTAASGLAAAGNTLYGTTYSGGANGDGVIFSVNADGTGFTVLHDFDSDNDGAYPLGNLVLSGGTLYGTTSAFGPTDGDGTIYSINTNGTDFTVLHSFNYDTDPGAPVSGLALSDGVLYGTSANEVFAINTNGSDYT